MLPSECRRIPDSQPHPDAISAMQIEKVDGFFVSAKCPEGGRYTRVMTASPIPDDVLAQQLTFSIDRSKKLGAFELVKRIVQVCNELLPAGRSYKLDGKLAECGCFLFFFHFKMLYSCQQYFSRLNNYFQIFHLIRNL